MDIIRAIVEGWSWQNITPRDLVDLNQFGNVIFTDEQGAYWLITPEELKCEMVASDKLSFEELKSDEEFQMDWSITHLCEVAKGRLGDLPRGMSYCLIVPGVFGHPYTAENMGIINTCELIRTSGDMACRIKDLPDGTKVRFKFI